MRTGNWKGAGLVALFAFATACSDDNSLAPAQGAQELQDAELSVIAETQADLLDGVLDGEIEARPLVVEAGATAGSEVAFSMVPITTTFTFERVRPCRAGGQIVATGQGTHVADRETGIVTLDFSGSKAIESCARARGDVVITLNGDGTFEGHRMKENGRYSGLQTNHQEGAFTWETSDGRSGECRYEIDAVWDPATHTKTITGFICDREINRTVTRDGAPGNDRASDG